SAGGLMVTLRILHGAMMMSIVIYAGIVYFLTSRPPNTSVERAVPSPSMTWIFGGAGVALFVLAIVFRKRGAATSLYDEGSAPASEPVATKDQNGGSKYLSKCLVSWVLCEAVAVMGLVLSFLH